MKMTQQHFTILTEEIIKTLIRNHERNLICAMILLSAHIVSQIVIELEMNVNGRFVVGHQLQFEGLLVPVVAEPADVVQYGFG
jgi:hypothetical protein